MSNYKRSGPYFASAIRTLSGNPKPYHTAYCQYAKGYIQDWNRFETEAEAAAKGHRPCKQQGCLRYTKGSN